MKNYMPIATFDDFNDASNLAVELRETGFEAELRDEGSEQRMMFLKAHPRAQFKVVVPRAFCEAAQEHLDRLITSSDPLVQSVIRCPECGSTRVEYPQFSRNTLLGSIGPAVASLTGMLPQMFFCQACQHTWDPNDSNVTVPPDEPRNHSQDPE
jgi:hypothetical protein